jgi:uncharacterized delta-60 repeat protein
MKKIILLPTLFITLNLIYSQPGQLDPFFGTNGIVRNSFGPKINESTQGKQVLLQADGSMYIVTETKEQTLIAKRLKNGSPDSSYGNNGFSVSVPFSGAHAAMQSDGKIVVAGSSNNEVDYIHMDISIARFNTNGSLDNTFNGNGEITIDWGSSEMAGNVAIQKDGKIIVGETNIMRGKNI